MLPGLKIPCLKSLNTVISVFSFLTLSIILDKTSSPIGKLLRVSTFSNLYEEVIKVFLLVVGLFFSSKNYI